MKNEEKAAILLLSLEEEQAAEVIKNLRPDEVGRVGKNMTRLTEISDEDIERAAGDFCALAREKGTRIVSVNNDIVKGIIRRALGDDKAKYVLKMIEEENFRADTSAIDKLRCSDPNPSFLLME